MFFQFHSDAKGFSGSEKKAEALENLYYLHHVCSTSNSFSKVFNYSAERGRIDNRILNISTKNEATYDGAKKDLWKFFKQASPSCSEMIVKCIWEKEVRNCTELFAPLETDNGKCCTFNMVPPSILHRFKYDNTTSVLERKLLGHFKTLAISFCFVIKACQESKKIQKLLRIGNGMEKVW